MYSNNNHIKYKDYELEDFLTDEFFIQWVKNPNENNIHFWEKWLEMHDYKKEVVMEAVSFIRSIEYREIHVMKSEIYLDVFEKIIKGEPKEVSIVKHGLKSIDLFAFFTFRKIAIILLLSFCSWTFYSISIKTSELTIEPVEWITKVNKPGKKTLITLEDGSIIHLNSGSQITYPSRFSDTIRSISLIGEAFFDVAEESRPFIVDLGRAKIEVLGTSFNASKSSDDKLEVALLKGKVKVNDRIGNQVILLPSEMLILEKDGEFQKSKFDSLEIIGWKDKNLVFKNDDFFTVKRKIENWYGVELTFSGRLPKTWAYTGNYHDETLKNVLEGIKHTSRMRYKISGKKVKLYN